MPSLPAPPPDIHTERMGRADGCPECIYNVETPLYIPRSDDTGFTAAYTCTSCRHSWVTAWGDL